LSSTLFYKVRKKGGCVNNNRFEISHLRCQQRCRSTRQAIYRAPGLENRDLKCL